MKASQMASVLRNCLCLLVRYDDPEEGERVQANFTPGELQTAREVAQEKADAGYGCVSLHGYMKPCKANGHRHVPCVLERFKVRKVKQVKEKRQEAVAV